MLQLNLPSDMGSYLLVYFLCELVHLKVGKLGECEFRPGYYIYCGSAKGPGGLRARINHHIKPSNNPHWHIDYFKNYAQLVAVGYTTELDRFECHWSGMLDMCDSFHTVLTGFGASDCSCKTHFYFCENPFEFLAGELGLSNFVFLDKNEGNSP